MTIETLRKAKELEKSIDYNNWQINGYKEALSKEQVVYKKERYSDVIITYGETSLNLDPEIGKKIIEDEIKRLEKETAELQKELDKL